MIHTNWYCATRSLISYDELSIGGMGCPPLSMKRMGYLDGNRIDGVGIGKHLNIEKDGSTSR